MTAPLGRPRVRIPSSARAGEVIEIRTLIDHPMETGLRKDADGKLVPRDILAGFVARANGAEVFSAVFRNATSAHPYLVFYARVTASTEFEFVWTHEDGRTARTAASVTIG
ncbi:thiosulfate oxidation carrier complex protein SoxZ [Blastochloris viridis]|uniref:Sulfur oxidation protein SoxZ n=1 Tax=Blastochloris viridis TaxID=1079 RepID=A0A0H5BDF4_BLAVI|nr:thiosulfate oxidation carrier complex protein SoxZ [Blastochloris viridis]ALK09833.1 sulfur oxidation protein SoxZ [Blastochloris viridis]BAS00263.1 sulfur oxidation protein SoxZ [Blastochloris viridis]CUU42496.1 sulfur oxidation protein SoxZ [Blastochloris viridis]